MDFRDASRLMYTPQEMQQIQAQQAQSQAVEKSSMLQEQLGIRKISDALELKQAADMAKIGAKLGVTTVQKGDSI